MEEEADVEDVLLELELELFLFRRALRIEPDGTKFCEWMAAIAANATMARLAMNSRG